MLKLKNIDATDCRSSQFPHFIPFVISTFQLLLLVKNHLFVVPGDHLHPAPGGTVLHLQLPQQDLVAPPVADTRQAGERPEGQEGDEKSGQDFHRHSHSLRTVLATLPRILPRTLLLSGKSIIHIS